MSRFTRLRPRLQFLTRKHREPSNTATVNLQGHKWTWSIQLCSKLVTIGALVTAIAFGGASRAFTIKTKTVLGSSVDPDLQLAFLGLINKILDLFVTKALQVTAGFTVTLWMTQSRHLGVRLADLELAEELTKPWAALSKFGERWSNRGWRHADWVRLIITLPVSVCVILQGLAINTIGVPKERWTSELRNVSVSHPLVQLQGIDWMNFWNAAWATVGDGERSWQVADSYIASSTYIAFRDFAWKLGTAPPGWQAFGNSGDEHTYPALDTRANESSCRGMAVNSSQAMDIFTWLQQNGTGDARRAIGINADLKLTLPGATVTCQPSQPSQHSQPSSSSNPWNLSVAVDDPVPISARATAFNIHLLSDSSFEFEGVTCEVRFYRLLFPANIWFIDGETTASASVNVYGKNYEIEPEILSSTPSDANMTTALATKLRSIMSRLETMTSGMTCAQWLVSVARGVRAQRAKVPGAQYENDIDALAPTVALFVNQLLVSAQWRIAYNEDRWVESSSVRWQLFGSGPRLSWAWSAAIILSILVIVLTASVFLSLYHRIVPGEWLNAGGMLVAANSSPQMPELKTALEGSQSSLDSTLFGVRQARQTAQSNIAAIVMMKSSTGRHVRLEESYKWL